MRRKTDKDIIKENNWLIIGSVFLILLGIFVAILPHIAPHVGYDSLQTKEVTISEFRQHYGARGAKYDYIRTTDGQIYKYIGRLSAGTVKRPADRGPDSNH